MDIGIGLGGFARGAVAGYGIGERMHEGWEKRKQKRAHDSAIGEGKAAYDKAVDSGEAQPNDPDALMRFIAPRIFKARLEAAGL
jgi:hypothetical protein